MIVVDEMACARLNETINAMSIDLFFKDEHTHTEYALRRQTTTTTIMILFRRKSEIALNKLNHYENRTNSMVK